MRADFFLAVVILLSAGGCTSNEAYPKAWSAPVGGGCAALSGIYSDFGEEASPPIANYRPRLAPRFFARLDVDVERSKVLDRADHVVLTYRSDGVLLVDVRQADASLMTAQFSEKGKTLKCTREGAFISGYAGWARGAGNPLVGREHNNDTLMSASDGSLLIKYNGGGTGLIFGVYPMSVSRDSWFRWPRIDTPPKSP